MTTEIAVGRIAVLKAAGLDGLTIAWCGGSYLDLSRAP